MGTYRDHISTEYRIHITTKVEAHGDKQALHDTRTALCASSMHVHCAAINVQTNQRILRCRPDKRR
jgi:hypothetical protein